MLIPIFAFTLLVTTSHAQQSSDSTCSKVSEFSNLNATGSASLLGVRFDNATGEIASDPSRNWTISTTVSETSHPQGSESHLRFWSNTPDLKRAGSPPPAYNACLIMISSLQQPNDACLSPDCLAALENQYAEYARDLARSTGPAGSSQKMTPAQVCTSLKDHTPALECNSFFDSANKSAQPDLGYRSSYPLDVLSVPAMNCTPSLPVAPGLLSDALGASNAVAAKTRYRLYDQRVLSPHTYVVAVWANNTVRAIKTGPAGNEFWGEARVGCVRPATVNKGSRVPGASSAASGRLVGWTREFAVWSLASLVVCLAHAGL